MVQRLRFSINVQRSLQNTQISVNVSKLWQKKGAAPLRELLYILDKPLKIICISTSLKEIQIISIFPTLRSSCGTWTPWTSVTLLLNFALSSSPTPTWPSLQECCRQLIIRQLSGNICFPPSLFNGMRCWLNRESYIFCISAGHEIQYRGQWLSKWDVWISAKSQMWQSSQNSQNFYWTL